MSFAWNMALLYGSSIEYAMADLESPQNISPATSSWHLAKH